MKIDREYPRPVRMSAGEARLRRLAPADRDAIVALALSIPERDRLFLRRDITQPVVVEHWIEAEGRGELATVVAEVGGQLAGYASVEPEREPWSRHVGELRILVGASHRGVGLGRLLTQEAFAMALSAGLAKLTARMMPDQEAAYRTFLALGFRSEALLLGHVRDHQGRSQDLVVMGHDVAAFHAMLQAYGVADALGD